MTWKNRYIFRYLSAVFAQYSLKFTRHGTHQDETGSICQPQEKGRKKRHTSRAGLLERYSLWYSRTCATAAGESGRTIDIKNLDRIKPKMARFGPTFLQLTDNQRSLLRYQEVKHTASCGNITAKPAHKCLRRRWAGIVNGR